MTDPGGFEAFVAARSGALLRAGWLLTGDWAGAEDLVQTALLKCWPKWAEIQAPEAYVRRAMVRSYVSWLRRRSSSELPSAALPEVLMSEPGFGRTDDGIDLREALAGLPRRQRAAVVLRYFLDLSEADTAETMGCSVGTVKSTTHKALAALRTSALLADLAEGR